MSRRSPLLLVVLIPSAAIAQSPGAPPYADPSITIPRLATITGRPETELGVVVSRFQADQTALTRRYDAPDSPAQRGRMRAFYTGWQARLRELDFDQLGQEGKVDYVLLNNHLIHQVALLDRADAQRAEEAALLPFADRLLALQDARRNLETQDPRAAARTLAEVTQQADSLRGLLEPAGRGGAGPGAGSGAGSGANPVSKAVANRAADDLDQIRNAVRAWFRYYDGYDPVFSWWIKDPQAKLDEALTRYARTIRERIVGIPPAQQSAGGTPAPGRAAAGGVRAATRQAGATTPDRSSVIPSAPRGSGRISGSK